MQRRSNISLEVFIDVPLRWPVTRNPGERQIVEKSISEFNRLSGIKKLRLDNGSSFPIVIHSMLQEDAPAHLKRQIKDKRSIVPRCYIRVASEARYSDEDLVVSPSGPKISKRESLRLFTDLACSELYATVLDLYVACTLAVPGGFDCWQFWLFADRNFIRRHEGAATTFFTAKKRASELGWPTIRNMKSTDVLRWLQGIPGFVERVGRGRVGRAIAAITYLVRLSKEEQELALVWALLGLEALYGDGNVGLRSQLLGKSEAYLGTRQDNKKKFGWMYDFRSRLIHGDLDIIFQHNDRDATKEVGSFWDDLYECEDLATAILLATLQKLCHDNSYSLDFEYVLKRADSVSARS